MSAIEYTATGTRTITVDVDYCDGELGSVSLFIRDGGGTHILFLTEEQAMMLGSELCAKALTARDQVAPHGHPDTDDRFEDARDLATFGLDVGHRGPVLDRAEGEGRR